MTTSTKKRTRLGNLEASFQKNYGANAARLGGLRKPKIVVPTGSLALDYELGTGGWPLGKLIGVFGPRDIGKSSMIGLNGVRSAQAQGLTAGWVAYEDFDEEWAEANGVDVENLFVAYPESAEEAWAMLHTMIQSGEVSFIVFDSIGALRGASEIKEDGGPRVGGVALINTWGVSVAAPMAARHNVAVILLNQVRTLMAQTHGVVYTQPGGNAIEHMESIIVQLKRGKAKYTIKQNSIDVLIGSEIKAVIQRNKCSQGSGRTATFDYFYAETEDHKLGVDFLSDTVNTAMRTGVIVKRGSMYDLPDGQSLKGIKTVDEYLADKPDVVNQIREGVIAAMDKRNEKSAVVEEPVEEDEE